mmetsp:Transcript_14711/g.34679  ORF Transcript_14711/g.34679 Transcript_14711/m.34679 type:complete len:292 (+) Transcript_14711:542-1417(+)
MGHLPNGVLKDLTLRPWACLVGRREVPLIVERLGHVHTAVLGSCWRVHWVVADGRRHSGVRPHALRPTHVLLESLREKAIAVGFRIKLRVLFTAYVEEKFRFVEAVREVPLLLASGFHHFFELIRRISFHELLLPSETLSVLLSAEGVAELVSSRRVFRLERNFVRPLGILVARLIDVWEFHFLCSAWVLEGNVDSIFRCALGRRPAKEPVARIHRDTWRLPKLVFPAIRQLMLSAFVRLGFLLGPKRNERRLVYSSAAVLLINAIAHKLVHLAGAVRAITHLEEARCARK